MPRWMHMKEPVYPPSEWEVAEEAFSAEYNRRSETLFSLGNGYLGFRGNFEEGWAGPPGTGLEGTYINGFHESWPVRYPEAACGFAEKGQTMLNVTNGKVIRLFLGDEEFGMLAGKVEGYRRRLSLKDGLLVRSLVWEAPGGRRVRLSIQRLVSLAHKHIAAVRYEVTPLNFSGLVKLVSELDGNVENLPSGDDPRVGSGLSGRALHTEYGAAAGDRHLIVQKTRNSKLSLACAMANHVETNSIYSVSSGYDGSVVRAEYRFQAKQGEVIRLDKFICYVTSQEGSEDELPSMAEAEASYARGEGFEALGHEQRLLLDDFWHRSDVEIKGEPYLQQGIRFNLFQLLQSAGRDGRTSIAAKGLTGEGYEGHYFWDTETFVLPFFLYSSPGISKKLLEYRCNTLEKAIERARQLSQKGALFPWRTIDGEECSSYFPAGTAQYHIDADIALAAARYMEASEDTEFLTKYGAELLFETARLWADLGAFIPSKGGKFCINGVTGPDEYSAIVNNNCYTNLMAQANMRYAYETALLMQRDFPGEYAALAERIGMDDGEPGLWKKAADNMYVPYDLRLGIHLQDDAFLDREPWDFENTPAENYPLLLHYHPLVIYRHQVCKQADMVLALFLLGSLFSDEQKRRDFDFYEKFTTHDSSLSTSIFCIMACEVGYPDKAYKYFISTARMDLDDYHGNTGDGIHAANMAGTWMCVVNGFAGMRAFDGQLSFKPFLPKHWQGFSFSITFKGRLLKVTVSLDTASYKLLEGEPLTILHYGKSITLAANENESIMGIERA